MNDQGNQPNHTLYGRGKVIRERFLPQVFRTEASTRFFLGTSFLIGVGCAVLAEGSDSPPLGEKEALVLFEAKIRPVLVRVLRDFDDRRTSDAAAAPAGKATVANVATPASADGQPSAPRRRARR